MTIQSYLIVLVGITNDWQYYRGSILRQDKKRRHLFQRENVKEWEIKCKGANYQPQISFQIVLLTSTTNE